jgi:hypothetical protein
MTAQCDKRGNLLSYGISVAWTVVERGHSDPESRDTASYRSPARLGRATTTDHPNAYTALLRVAESRFQAVDVSITRCEWTWLTLGVSALGDALATIEACRHPATFGFLDPVSTHRKKSLYVLSTT